MQPQQEETRETLFNDANSDTVNTGDADGLFSSTDISSGENSGFFGAINPMRSSLQQSELLPVHHHGFIGDNRQQNTAADSRGGVPVDQRMRAAAAPHGDAPRQFSYDRQQQRLMPSPLTMVAAASMHVRDKEAERTLYASKEFSKSLGNALATSRDHSSRGTTERGGFKSLFLIETYRVLEQRTDLNTSRRALALGESRTLSVGVPFKYHKKLDKIDARTYQQFFSECVYHDNKPHAEPVHPFNFFTTALITEVYDGAQSFMEDVSLAASYGVTIRVLPSKAALYNMYTDEAAEFIELYLRPKNGHEYEALVKAAFDKIAAEYNFVPMAPVAAEHDKHVLPMMLETLKFVAIVLEWSPQYMLLQPDTQSFYQQHDEVRYVQTPFFPGFKPNMSLGLDGLNAILNRIPGMNKVIRMTIGANGEHRPFTFFMQLQLAVSSADRRDYQQGPMKMAKNPGGVAAVDVGLMIGHISGLQARTSQYHTGINPFTGSGTGAVSTRSDRPFQSVRQQQDLGQRLWQQQQAAPAQAAPNTYSRRDQPSTSPSFPPRAASFDDGGGNKRPAGSQGQDGNASSAKRPQFSQHRGVTHISESQHIPETGSEEEDGRKEDSSRAHDSSNFSSEDHGQHQRADQERYHKDDHDSNDVFTRGGYYEYGAGGGGTYFIADQQIYNSGNSDDDNNNSSDEESRGGHHNARVDALSLELQDFALVDNTQSGVYAVAEPPPTQRRDQQHTHHQQLFNPRGGHHQQQQPQTNRSTTAGGAGGGAKSSVRFNASSSSSTSPRLDQQHRKPCYNFMQTGVCSVPNCSFSHDIPFLLEELKRSEQTMTSLLAAAGRAETHPPLPRDRVQPHIQPKPPDAPARVQQRGDGVHDGAVRTSGPASAQSL